MSGKALAAGDFGTEKPAASALLLTQFRQRNLTEPRLTYFFDFCWESSINLRAFLAKSDSGKSATIFSNCTSAFFLNTALGDLSPCAAMPSCFSAVSPCLTCDVLANFF